MKRSLFRLALCAILAPLSLTALPDRVGDLDEDGKATIIDLVRLNNHLLGQTLLPSDLRSFGDVDGDGYLSQGDATVLRDQILERLPLETLPLTFIREASPTSGEGGVAVKRETVFRLSVPLAVDSGLDGEKLFAEFGGQRLPTRIQISSDRKTVTLFYSNTLPASALVRVTFIGDGVKDITGRDLDLDGDGEQGGTMVLDFETLSLSIIDGTAVCGRVFASELADAAAAEVSVNRPLEGATITVDGMEDTLFAITDEFGNFRLEPAPAGRFFVHIDGRTATQNVPEGSYYPFVGKAWESIPGEESEIGEVYLPLVQDGTLQAVSETEATTVRMPGSVISQFPELEFVSITVPAGSLYNDDGTPGGMVGIAPVPPDRLPGKLPEGLNTALVITVQTDGATNFDVPAPLCLPNLPNPDTGVVLPPGATTALWSFNHDTGRFEIVGPATVSADGKSICTDPGVGVLAPGWGLFADGTGGGGGGTRRGGGGTRRRGEAENQECAKNDCPCDGHCGTAAQVLLHSGEEVLNRQDLFIPGRAGMDFVLNRTYRSQFRYDGPLGYGWNWDYNEGLWIEDNGDVVRINGRSHIATWKRTETGSYTAPDGYFGILVQASDGGYILMTPDGFRRYYRDDGRLFCHEDRFGNRMLFDYDPRGNLSKVLDVFGREIDFVFQTFADGVDRLIKVRDFIGREVGYTYDSNGDLISVRSPVITGTPTGNNFPNGRTERYTYSSDFAPEELNHNLLSVTMPEEVAANGPPACRWTYGADPADPLTFDKVLTETRGGTNGSGVEAGGIMSIEYATLNQSESEDQPELPRGRARVTSRNGNVSEYYVNEDNFHILTREFVRGLREDEPEYYETRSVYDEDGQLIQVVSPEGNEVRYTYDSTGGRRSQSNLLEARRIAGPRGGGEDLITTYTYEPLFNQVSSITDPRGNASNYTPPTGAASKERYTTRIFYDYQESEDLVELADLFDMDLSSVPRGLGDLNDDERTDQVFGNMIRTESPSVQLLAGSAESARLGQETQPIISQTQWNDWGQPLGFVDPEGNLTRFVYHPENDPDGDGEAVVSRYVALSSDLNGYKAAHVSDAADTSRRLATTSPRALQTEFVYDLVGNMVVERDPRGVETHYVYNHLNEPVQQVRGASISAALERGELPSENTAFGYIKQYRYDHNGRVVSLSEENRGGNTPGVGEYVDTSFVYDINGNVIARSMEIDGDTSATTTFRFDESDIQIEARSPEGNKVALTYDEREKLFRRTVDADGSAPTTKQMDYDLNGNLVRVVDAADTDGDGTLESINIFYDGFDRAIRVVDALGNRVESTYDPTSSKIGVRMYGHPPGQPVASSVIQSETEFHRDELSRSNKVRQRLFIPSGYSPSGSVTLSDSDSDGWVSRIYEYNSNSLLVRTEEDDSDAATIQYDGLNRVIATEDAGENRIEFFYDSASNVVGSRAVEKSTVSGLEDDLFENYYVYDQLNRLVRMSDNVGQTYRYAYDSRDNRTSVSDGVGGLGDDPMELVPGQINLNGNLTRFAFDGLDRMVRMTRELRENGSGAGSIDTSNPQNGDGLVTEFREYDRDSHLVSTTDDRGNKTVYDYDGHDRLVRMVYPDDSETIFTFDPDNNLVSLVDPNGSMETREYDALNRLIEVSIDPADDVLGSTSVSYEYDGVGRISRQVDASGAGGADQSAEFLYDSLSRVIEETQNGRAVTTNWSGDSRVTNVRYPGGRVLNYSHDDLNRTTSIKEGTNTILGMAFIGSTLREVERNFGNGTSLMLDGGESGTLDGYDAIRRVTRLRVLGSGGSPIVDRAYEYNRANMRVSEVRSDDSGFQDSYEYDSLYRISRATFDSDGQGGTPRDLAQRAYAYDGVGNRLSTREVPQSGTEIVTDYSANSLNQYTKVGPADLVYDLSGNLVDDGVQLYAYDSRSRLVEVRSRATSNLIARYSYLADGRRVRKEVFDPSNGASVSATDFVYWLGQVVEERKVSSGDILSSYVSDPDRVDEVVQVSRTSAHPLGAGTFYLHEDARGNIVTVSDSSGDVAAKIRYDDFGGTEATADTGVPYSFQGRRLDPETGLLYFRNRYYHPVLGRFLQRDPAVDSANLGNLYTFVGNSPLSRSDPMGLKGKPNPELVKDLSRLLEILGILKEMDGARRVGQEIGDLKKIVGELDGLLARTKLANPSVTKPQLNAPGWMNQNMRANGAATEGLERLKSVANADAAKALSEFSNPGIKFSGLDAAMAGVSEAQISMNTTDSGGAVRVAGVAGINGLAGASPQATIASMISGIVDNVAKLGEAYEWWGPGSEPKAMEVYNNAGRSLGVLADFVSDWASPQVDCRGRKKPNSGWRSMKKLVDQMKNDQGSISRELAESGEWWGDKAGDLWNWASGESARAADLERQRQEMLRRRRN